MLPLITIAKHMPRVTWILKLCAAAAITVAIAFFVSPGGAVFFLAAGGGYVWWRGRAVERQTGSWSSWPKTLGEVGMSDYSKIFRAPWCLWVYAVMTIGAVVINAILYGNFSHHVFPLIGAMLVSLLLLRGIPAAWCFAVLIGVGAIISDPVAHGLRWPEGLYLLQLGLLLTPASRRYVWRDQGFLPWLRSQPITWKNIRQLAAFVVATLILAAILGNVRSDHPGLVIDALWTVAFDSYGLATIVLLWLLALAGAGWIARRIQPAGAN